MESLSHWDSAADFSGYEAAALVLGFDPSRLETPSTDQNRVNVVCERMAQDYERALKRLYHEVLNIHPEDPVENYSNSVRELMSIKLNNLFQYWTTNEDDDTFANWLINDAASSFETQKFSRETLSDWLDAIQLKTVYQFRPEVATAEEQLDPLDLPEELDAANMAHRQVLKGYGNPAISFRKRILAYLRQNYPHMKPDAIERIATVANTDKSPGRKKFNQ
jgi:L-rhamnose mutarotase